MSRSIQIKTEDVCRSSVMSDCNYQYMEKLGKIRRNRVSRMYKMMTAIPYSSTIVRDIIAEFDANV